MTSASGTPTLFIADALTASLIRLYWLGVSPYLTRRAAALRASLSVDCYGGRAHLALRHMLGARQADECAPASNHR
jgi:hypothetical protein